jgi:hypothetical protein
MTWLHNFALYINFFAYLLGLFVAASRELEGDKDAALWYLFFLGGFANLAATAIQRITS